MKTAKKVFIVASILLLVFLAGCKGKEEAVSKTKAFVGGNDGLAISFLDGMPPAEVFDVDSPFQIGVKVENKGEFDIVNADDVDVSITGITPSDFKVTAADLMKNPSEPLKGAGIDGSGNIIKGDYVTVDFPEMNYYAPVSGSIPFTIRANVCYEYGTKAQGKLCIRKDLRGVTGEEGTCNPNRQVPAENSGAPIQITNIRQVVAGANKIDFFFTIKKVKSTADSLYKTGSSCDSAIANRDVVHIELSDTGLGTLTCSGLKDGTATSGYTTLYNNEREIKCSQVIDNLADSEKVVDIKLKYAYKQFIDKELKVKHAS